jgi:hypothetical protein
MTTQATEASIVGGKRKKSVSGVAIEDDLPDHLHYHGNPPKEHCAHPGIYSTPVIPFTSRQWSYNHWIHRTNENNHCCIKCQQKIATGGNDDFSNSVKHVILNHPEISAWQDVVKHSSIAINQFKFMLERNFEPKAPTLTSTSGGATKSNSLGFSVTGSTYYFLLVLPYQHTICTMLHYDTSSFQRIILEYSILSNSKYSRTSIELVCLINILVVNLVASQFLYFISIITHRISSSRSYRKLATFPVLYCLLFTVSLLDQGSAYGLLFTAPKLYVAIY